MKFIYKIFSLILLFLCLNQATLAASNQSNIASEQLQALLMILQKKEELELTQKMAECAAAQAQKDADYKAAQKIEEEQKYLKKKRLVLLFLLVGILITGKIYYKELKAIFQNRVATPCHETYDAGKKRLEDTIDYYQKACDEKVAVGKKYVQEKVNAVRQDVRDTVRETITDPIHRHCTIEGNLNKLKEWGAVKCNNIKKFVTRK